MIDCDNFTCIHKIAIRKCPRYVQNTARDFDRAIELQRPKCQPDKNYAKRLMKAKNRKAPT